MCSIGIVIILNSTCWGENNSVTQKKKAEISRLSILLEKQQLFFRNGIFVELFVFQ